MNKRTPGPWYQVWIEQPSGQWVPLEIYSAGSVVALKLGEAYATMHGLLQGRAGIREVGPREMETRLAAPRLIGSVQGTSLPRGNIGRSHIG